MSVRILTGCARDRLRDLPDGSVHTIVTSPPYFGLRDYGTAGQIGLEETPDAYVAALVEVFRECRRVLRDDGTVWLNIGDSYAGGKMGRADGGRPEKGRGWAEYDMGTIAQRSPPPGLKAKDLIGIPWRVAFALQADGWYLRSDIIWAKPNPMPESVTDRPTSAHEHIFLLSKRPTYYYDAEAVKEDAIRAGDIPGGRKYIGDGMKFNANGKNASSPVADTRNLRNVWKAEEVDLSDVWEVATQPFKAAHFATFPPALIEPCIKAGCPEKCCPHCGAGWERQLSERPYPKDLANAAKAHGGIGNNLGGRRHQDWLAENPRQFLGFRATCSCPAHEPIGGTVLDCFGGAGTTGLVADRLGRNAILIELNPTYAAMAEQRIYADLPMFATVTMEAAE